MSRIFISHSSSDNAKTRAIIEWIVSHGWTYEEIFVDFDDITGGELWQESLKKAGTRCEVILLLISPAWVRSAYCIAEFQLAKLHNKKILPVVIESTPLDTLPAGLAAQWQLTDLTAPGALRTLSIVMPDGVAYTQISFADVGLRELIVSLKRAGLDPSSFPLTPDRKIYPGLAPLDIDDAAVFFGRDAEIARGIETLRQMRERGQSLLAILAASGAGKSSFLRAGLWPRLQRADREFLILPVLRPGVDALNSEQGLVAGLHRAGEALGLKRNLADWRAQIDSGDFAGAIGALHAAARTRMLAVDAAQASSTSTLHIPVSQQQTSLPPIPVLPIDQAEELFGAQGSEAARRLLDLLGTLLHEGRLIAIMAIRSDRYGDLQTAQALAGLEQRPFSLPPIADGVLKDVIEGPAQRDRAEHGTNGLKIDPQLTDRLLRDWADADNLPLLAFTLRRLLDDYGSDGQLVLEEYEHSGQLQGALETAIARAMQDAIAAGTLPEDAQEREALIRSTFVPWLVSIDPQSQRAQRRISRRDELPARSEDLIERLIDARLLTCDHPQDSNAYVEVAHEAILSHWPLLDRIIGQEREALIVLNEVIRDAKDWHVSEESEDTLLHRGERLRHAEQHLAREDFQRALGDKSRRYLANCRARETQEIEDRRIQQAREAKQIARTRKLQRRATVLLVAIIAVIAIAGVTLTRLLQTTSQASANILANLAPQSFDRHEYDRAVRFALAGVRKRDATLRSIDVSAAENQLHRAGYRSSLRVTFKHEGEVGSTSVSRDGSRVLTTSGKTAHLWDAASGKILVTIRNDEEVFNAAFSDAGHRIITVSGHTARLWEAGSGALLTTMWHDGKIVSVAFSDDGHRIVTASEDGTACLWEVASGQKIATMSHETAVFSAAFSADGRRIVTASGDTAQLWQAGAEKPLATMRHDEKVVSATFSPDGRRIVTASWDETARLWEAGAETPLATMRHGEEVFSAVFSPDGLRIVTASWDNTARLWEAGAETALVTMRHDGQVNSAAFSVDGSRIVTACLDGTARIWEAGSETPLATMQHDREVVSAAFSADGRRIITASGNIARLWDATSRTPLAKMSIDEEVVSAAFGTDSRPIVPASLDKTARLWRTGLDTLLGTMQQDRPVVTAALSAHGSRIVTASNDGSKTARLWQAGSETPFATMQHDGDVVSAAFSPDGRRIITASLDNTVRLWETGAERPLATMRHDGDVVSAAFSSDGRHIITASRDKTARVWQAGLETPLATMPHDKEVVSAAFSPDGHRIVTASGNTARLWEAGAEMPNATMRHDGDVVSAAFSSDGRRIITASRDNTARLWEAGAEKPLATMRHDGEVVSAAFSPDGRRIVTASRDKAVHVWQAGLQTPLAMMRHDKEVVSATFSPDGRRIVTVSDKTARLWDAGFFLLDGHKLIDTICRDILNVDTNAPPRDTDLSRLTDEELQMAVVIDPNIERDVCRAPSRWQRLLGMFGFSG